MIENTSGYEGQWEGVHVNHGFGGSSLDCLFLLMIGERAAQSVNLDASLRQKLLHVLLLALNVPASSANKPFFQFNVLRILALLLEKDEPYFLDCVLEAPYLPLMIKIISTISQEISNSVQLVQLGNRISLEALRVLELAADDSNYKQVIIKENSLSFLRLLSIPVDSFARLWNPSKVCLIQVMATLFRIICNCQCYNPLNCAAVCENFFAKTCVKLMQIHKHSLNSHNIVTNGWTLFVKVKSSSKWIETPDQDFALYRRFMEVFVSHLEDPSAPYPSVNDENVKPSTVPDPTCPAFAPIFSNPQHESSYFQPTTTTAQDSDDTTKGETDPLPSSPPPVCDAVATSSGGIFSGVVCAFTQEASMLIDPTVITSNGGVLFSYIPRHITVIVAKQHQFLNPTLLSAAVNKCVPIVTVKWITDSLEANRCLPVAGYFAVSFSHIMRELQSSYQESAEQLRNVFRRRFFDLKLLYNTRDVPAPF